MSNGIDYEAILIELEDAYRETESKVGSWQKKVLLLILKTLITIISDIKQCFMYTAFGERHPDSGPGPADSWHGRPLWST